jgi:hypothetical protein
MVILVGLALVLVWSVYQHHATVPNADQLTTVSLSTRADSCAKFARRSG